METARPALSSAGELIFDPDDNRASDWLNRALDCPSNPAVVCADMFVFMTILLTPSLSHPFRGFWFCTASLPFGGPLKRRPPVIPSGCLRPPATVSRQPTIGGSRRDLSVEISEINLPSGLTLAGMDPHPPAARPIHAPLRPV
jgi:hypothetical protein